MHSVKLDRTYFDGVTESSTIVDSSSKSGSKPSWPFLWKQEKDKQILIGLKLVLHNAWRKTRINPNDNWGGVY